MNHYTPDRGQASHDDEELTWQQQAADFILPEMKGFYDGHTYGGSAEAGAYLESVSGPQFNREMAPEQYDQSSGMTYEEAYQKYSEMIDGEGSLGSELAGAALSGYGTGASVSRMGGRLKEFLALASTEGAIAGALGSQPGDRVNGAWQGMLIGLLSGTLSPAGVKIYEYLKGVFRPGANEMDNLLREYSKGVDWQELLGNPKMVLGDASPELSSLVGNIARDSAQAYRAMVEVLGERIGTSLNRVNTIIGDAFKPQLDSTGMSAVNAARQQIQKPMYMAAYKPDGKPVYVSYDPKKRTPEMNRFLESRGFTDSVNSMLNKYDNAYDIEPYRPVYETRQVDSNILGPDGNPIKVEKQVDTGKREYSLAFIHDVAKDLGEAGDQLFSAFKARPGKGTMRSHSAGKGREGVASRSNDLVRAQTFAGQTIRMKNAYQAGRDAVKDGTTVNDIRATVKDIQASQAQWMKDKEAYGFGTPTGQDDAMEAFRSGFSEAMHETALRRNVSYEVMDNFQDVNFREKMNLILPRRAVEQFQRGIKREMRYLTTARFADRGGGVTSRLGGHGLDDAVTTLRTAVWGTPWAYLEAGQKVLDKLRGPGLEKFRAALGDALMSNDPELIERLMSEALKEGFGTGNNILPRITSQDLGPAPRFEGDR